MTTTTPESRARLAYTAYCKAVDFRSVNGDPLPPFDEQPERLRTAWGESARVLWELATTGHSTL